MIKWFKRKNKIESQNQSDDMEQEATASNALGQESEPADVDSAAAPRETAPDAEHGESAMEDSPSLDQASEHDLDVEIEDDAIPEKGRFFKRLRERLHKTREQFVTRVDRLVLGKKTIDLDLLDELEEVLITADLGVRTTQLLIERVAEKIKRKELNDPAKLRDHLRDEIRAILSVKNGAWDIRSHHPFIVMVIGVNGVGKTTTIGKLAHRFKQQGLRTMLVAADTFRAAAIEQLTLWGERVDVPVIRQQSGSDPSAVAFDALDAAIARDTDVVLLDTAGRMHTKVNLMEELKKVHRVISKKLPGAPHEILLVLDATTGQNALSQVQLFKKEIGVTGLILTKLDGTAKGGIIVPICQEVQVPVRYIGIGEGLEDLRPFDPDEFSQALF